MEEARHLDDILKEWPFDPGSISVRLVAASDGREVIQMRIEMGLLQLETTARPDGMRPGDADTYFDFLQREKEAAEGEFQLNEEQCFECDREFVQFYHRRICWLALQKYEFAVIDADHSLALMDLCRDHSLDEEWTMSHEQYRPFVMYHRVQANALSHLDNDSPEAAVESINRGLDDLRAVFVEHELEEQFDEDELVNRLVELRESLRSQFDVGKTLQEQLAEAVAQEHYELAARLRDELDNRRRGK